MRAGHRPLAGDRAVELRPPCGGVGPGPRRTGACPVRTRGGRGRRRSGGGRVRRGEDGLPVLGPGITTAGNGMGVVRSLPGVRGRIRRRVRGLGRAPGAPPAGRGLGRGRGAAEPDRVRPGRAVRDRGGAVPAGGIVGHAPGLRGGAFDR